MLNDEADGDNEFHLTDFFLFIFFGVNFTWASSEKSVDMMQVSCYSTQIGLFFYLLDVHSEIVFQIFYCNLEYL